MRSDLIHMRTSITHVMPLVTLVSICVLSITVEYIWSMGELHCGLGSVSAWLSPRLHWAFKCVLKQEQQGITFFLIMN